jgi:ADP-ribosylglycohydrolase
MTMAEIKDYRSKVLGCWMGKNIGGTLGAPFEWRRQINSVEFYTQKHDGNPLPNDDLDIQLLWLIALEEQGVDIDSSLLGEYWLSYVTPFWAEYGTAKINLRSGLVPPLSGIWNNFNKDSDGAFIRSEIWACIAPGCPRQAVKFAQQDAMLDHGNGEGVYAEVFCAALESAAFVESDAENLIKIGLSYIPESCGVARAVNHVLSAYESCYTWLETRDQILKSFRGSLLGGDKSLISQRDMDMGFAEGHPGWDVPSNIAILVIGLLYGEGDFDKSLCTAVNCGEDTDCTGATLGSIFGIMHGIENIPEKWIKPIGHGIKTACLNLGDLGSFGAMLPATVEELTDRVEKIAHRVVSHYQLPVQLPTIAVQDKADNLFARKEDIVNLTIPRVKYKHPFFDIAIRYDTGPSVEAGGQAVIQLIVVNRYRMQANLAWKWYLPDGWTVKPGGEGLIYVGQSHWHDSKSETQFTLSSPLSPTAINRFVLQLTMDGHHTSTLMPIVLVTGKASAKALER